jgi:DNA-directed RNA polymerase specialized sigma24 family protein
MSRELSDGFGDDRSNLDYEEYLLDNERLLKLKAGERMRGSDVASDIWDDVLQEGRIVQWTVLKKRPSSPPAYVSAAMSHRIIECLTRGTWTGMTRTHGKPLDPLRRRDRDSVNDETLGLTEVIEAADLVDDVAVAYHHGEIMSALNALTFTQRSYVFARFWLGKTNPEIAAERGLSTSEIERQWRVNIRPALVEELPHLINIC